MVKQRNTFDQQAQGLPVDAGQGTQHHKRKRKGLAAQQGSAQRLALQAEGGIEQALIALLVNAGNVFYAQTRPLLQHLRDIDFADDPQAYSAQMMDILLRGIAAR